MKSQPRLRPVGRAALPIPFAAVGGELEGGANRPLHPSIGPQSPEMPGAAGPFGRRAASIIGAMAWPASRLPGWPASGGESHRSTQSPFLECAPAARLETAPFASEGVCEPSPDQL